MESGYTLYIDPGQTSWIAWWPCVGRSIKIFIRVSTERIAFFLLRIQLQLDSNFKSCAEINTILINFNIYLFHL